MYRRENIGKGTYKVGYLCLTGAVALGAMKGAFGKKVSFYVKNALDSLFFNFIRMFLCVACGAVMVVLSGAGGFKVDGLTISLAILNGVLQAVFVCVWIMAVKNVSYVMLDVFALLSAIIPTVGCRIMYSTKSTFFELAGFAVLIVAALLLASYNAKLKGSFSLKTTALLLLNFLAQGFMDFCMQVFKRSGATGTNAAFNFYTFIFTAVCLAGIYTVLTFFRKRGEDKKYLVSFGEQLAAEAGVLKKVFVFITLMAVCLFFNSYLTTIASGLLSPSVLSPLRSGLALILSTVIAWCYKEKPSVKSIAGTIIAFGGLIVMNAPMIFGIPATGL